MSILVASRPELRLKQTSCSLEALGAVSKLATVKHKFVKRNPWLANRKTPVAAMPLAGDSVVLLTAGGGYVFADCKTGIKLRISKANCKADSLIAVWCFVRSGSRGEAHASEPQHSGSMRIISGKSQDE